MVALRVEGQAVLYASLDQICSGVAPLAAVVLAFFDAGSDATIVDKHEETLLESQSGSFRVVAS